MEVVNAWTKIENQDPLQFWSRQISEHALFFWLGIVETNERTRSLRNEAYELYQVWDNIWTGNPRAMDYNSALASMRNLHENFLNATKAEWTGWIFPDFIVHTLKELNFMDASIRGPVDRTQRLGFWSEVNMDHSDFASSLLDPRERELVDKARNFSKRFRKIRQKMGLAVAKEEFLRLRDDSTMKSLAHRGDLDFDQYLALTLTASGDLDKFTETAAKGIHDRSILSVIHPALIDHVRREGQRSIIELASDYTSTGKRLGFAPKGVLVLSAGD